jgi:cell filamentation protein
MGRGRTLYAASALSLLAGLIHLWVTPEHFEEWWGYGLFFMFAAAAQVPRLMECFSQSELADHTPCVGLDEAGLVAALARTHAELVLIHPFREGNGRCARLLGWLMALQAGWPPLDFTPLSGRGKPAYFAAVQAALARDYAPLERCFTRVLARTSRVVVRAN